MSKPKKPCAHRLARVKVNLFLDIPVRLAHRLSPATVAREIASGVIQQDGADWEGGLTYCPSCGAIIDHGTARLSNTLAAYRRWVRAYAALNVTPIDGDERALQAAEDEEREARAEVVRLDPGHAMGLAEMEPAK